MSSQSGRILSRNILGSSFLETFGDVVSSVLPKHDIPTFCERLLSMFQNYPPIDRTRRNLGSLAVASLTVAEFYSKFQISDIELDECRATGTASGGVIKNAFISQLDCRGANLSAVQFENTSVISLIADRETVLPDSFPEPQQIRDISRSAGTIFSPEECRAWINDHLENPPTEDISLVPVTLKQHPAIKLLQRACRIRQYWLRRGDDIYAARILDDAWWPAIERLLAANDLLKVELRQASGTDARFVHVRQADDILVENENDPAVVRFYRELVAELTEGSL
ncbi:hypothetical protein [Gluconacetobacter tumulisoli]|uniref:Uncharacterized protein n=1 Tax=Gluconacetobacter tumulisoli TaxID=1286189 RepID=A0A7W4PMU7_9PROT|nr:hypothetical protein [Gluconacetobacter tumulisoli]MBB2203393.1 hypothetical protein [Gluconacetobacter tumulisoli]